MSTCVSCLDTHLMTRIAGVWHSNEVLDLRWFSRFDAARDGWLQLVPSCKTRRLAGGNMAFSENVTPSEGSVQRLTTGLNPN